jgi:hypothetical protein
MARVERLLPRDMVRRIDDFLYFRGVPFQHDFESLGDVPFIVEG